MSEKEEKDGRWAKQFGDFAENLVMYVLGQLNDMSVALIDHVGADIIATKRYSPTEHYAISVKGRNFPPTEGKSYTFTQRNIRKLEETTNELFGDFIPAVAFVFVDEMEDNVKKIRIFTAELADIKQMCDDPEVGFLNWVADRMSFRYGESARTTWLTEIKECDRIDYFELQFNCL